jgi:preprotein translocase subunit SecA
MAHHSSAEERQIEKLIEEMPVSVDDRTRWNDSMRTDGMSEELAEEIHEALSKRIDGEEHDQAVTRMRYLINFTNLVKRWRLNNQSRHFGRR